MGVLEERELPYSCRDLVDDRVGRMLAVLWIPYGRAQEGEAMPVGSWNETL